MSHPALPSNVNHREAGVTLVELAIVLIVLSVMAAIAIPNMQGFLREARLSSQTDMLASSLQLARTEAVRQRQDITVCPLNNPATATACSTDVADWANGWAVMASGTILQRITGRAGVSMGNASATLPVAITFNRSQGNAASSTIFSLCSPNSRQRQISISLSGRIVRQLNTTTCP